ncbi:MAG: phytoene/squalene synthase family protein [Saprospiraceae bacterium]|jgi:phytoene/squalene synthetase|nr:phytoene/squalene synthase family protein [Candidatus Opimibacter skivensis]MBL0009632.1 phytoene/squalene synthase family protein [Candidatus Opimibacter skivensis]
MLDLYNSTCQECSQLITRRYSTSFSAGIKAFDPSIRAPIYAIYGFVRFADEIVDTFHDFPQATLFYKFKEDTWHAIDEGISLNPVLNAFQEVVNAYNIDKALITAFLDSMEMDLTRQAYDDDGYDQYIYGSAEVVGLMCLYVFCNGNPDQYAKLKDSARSLGAAFQKINFLRDLKSDFEDRGRVYFPGVDFLQFTAADKLKIEQDILTDFQEGYKGILQLPATSRFGVYLAYVYYFSLFKKIKQTPCHKVQEKRIRVNAMEKLVLLFKSSVRMKLNML